LLDDHRLGRKEPNMMLIGVDYHPSFQQIAFFMEDTGECLSTVFAGQAVGIKEVEEGIWLVSFMDYDLGYIDLEEKTLQPLDNPFGPKVLPM
jgi:hypothetical protein